MLAYGRKMFIGAGSVQVLFGWGYVLSVPL